MVPVLLAAAVLPGPAAAPAPVGVATPAHVGNLAGDWRRGHPDRQRQRGHDRILVVNHWAWGGAMSHDPASAWRPNGYNDWWHDQPWRSYPRWVQQQGGGCPPERMWQSGGVWRC